MRRAEDPESTMNLKAPVLMWVFGVFAGPAAAAYQLPPAAEADRYLAQAETQIRNEHYHAALRSLDRVLRLQDEHNLDLPDQVWFKHAEVALEAGAFRRAFVSVMRYMEMAGPRGEHSEAALQVLQSAEKRDEVQPPEIREVAAAMDFVRIPPGEFRMGSTRREADRDESPVTRVRMNQGFWLGKYEVTQEWEAVVGLNPSYFAGCGRCPVEQVSWGEVQEFIWLLNAAERGNRYRLPTEAEWEYAARAGTTGDRHASSLDAIGWCVENSGAQTHPAGRKAPNAWGVHDMLGNVWEWVGDWYGAYPGWRVTDPGGPASGSFRVLRGGGWSNRSLDCRSSARSNDDPQYRYINLGFRLLRTP